MTSERRHEARNRTATNVLHKDCPSSSVLEMVAGKWQVLILYALQGGKRRYSELHGTVEGISQKMLTQTLRGLERSGLVKRTVYPVVPPHTEYELTELGESLDAIVNGLCGWGQNNLEAVLAAQRRYDGAAGGSNRPADVALTRT